MRILVEHLAANPCVDCRMSDVRVLELDHVVERHEYVSVLIQRGVHPDVLNAEMGRCEVVCANCHRRRTARRAGWKRLRAKSNEPLHRKPFVDANLRWIFKQLSEASCVDCGLRDPLVLEHDHVGPKRETVMTLVHSGFSRATIEREIAQCEIRCVNCHRIRTSESRGWYRSRFILGRSPP